MFLDLKDLSSLPRAYRLPKPLQHAHLATQDPLSIYLDLRLHSTLPFHQGCVNSIDWSHDGRLLATGSDDTQVAIWRYVNKVDCPHDERDKFVLTGQCLTGHEANIFSAKFFPHQESRLATAGGDDVVKVFDLSYAKQQNQASNSDNSPSNTNNTTVAKFAQLHEYYCCRGRAKKIDFDPTQPSIFFACSEDGTVRQWDTRERHPIDCDGERCILVGSPEAGNMGLYGVSVSPVRPYLMATCGVEPVIRVYDRRNLRPGPGVSDNYQNTVHRICDLVSSRKAVSGVNFAPNDLCLVASHMDGDIHLYDLAKTFVSEPLIQMSLDDCADGGLSMITKHLSSSQLPSFSSQAHRTVILFRDALRADKSNEFARAIALYAEWLTNAAAYRDVPEYRALMACAFYNRALCITRRDAMNEKGNTSTNVNTQAHGHKDSSNTATDENDNTTATNDQEDVDEDADDLVDPDASIDNAQNNLDRSASVERGIELASSSIGGEGESDLAFGTKTEQFLLRRQRFLLYALQDAVNGDLSLSLHMLHHALAEKPSLSCLGPSISGHSIENLRQPEQIDGYGTDEQVHILIKTSHNMIRFLYDNLQTSMGSEEGQQELTTERLVSESLTWSHLTKFLGVLKPMDLDFCTRILKNNKLTSIPVKMYHGHRNQHTVKEVSFIGQHGEYISSGGDGGLAFLWKRQTGEVAWMAHADNMAVNMIKVIL